MSRLSLWSIAALGAALACGEAPPPEARDPEPILSAPVPEEAQAPQDSADSSNPFDTPPIRYPRGLITNGSGAMPGYVLFNPLLGDTTYLIDNAGQVVHTWKTGTSPGGGIYLLPNGHLLRPGRDPSMKTFTAGGVGGILQELDWDGTTVWEWRLSDEGQVQHHDIEPLPDGNVLVLAWEVKTAEEAALAGRLSDQTPEQGLWPDWVLEIEPVRPRSANVVWEWHAWDHVVQQHDPKAPHHGHPRAHPHRLDLNANPRVAEISAEEIAQLQAIGYVSEDATPADLESDFLHTNAVAYNAALDQIALSIPAMGEIWIIDHGTTTAEAQGSAGDLLYRFGNPSVYGRAGSDDQRFFYQHDVRWIPGGHPGAGNLMVFNNGAARPDGSKHSSIDEWTPPLAEDGRYSMAAGEPFGPTELAWQYAAPDFYSPFISGAQRTANGNTMICSGTGGRLFEVTREGEIVWEYRNPFSGDVRNDDGSLPQPGIENSPYAVFRATRIPADHPGLTGRNLTALDPQPAWHEPSAASASGF